MYILICIIIYMDLKQNFGNGGRAGILPIFILNRLESRLCSGYDIINDINRLTDGSWKPGSSSVYPLLISMENKGLIKVVENGKRKRKKYTITQKGRDELHSIKKRYDEISIERWHTVRGIIMEILSPSSLAKMLNETIEMQTKSWKRILDSNEISKEDKIFLMKQNLLLLNRHMKWLEEVTKDFDKKKKNS